MYICRLKFFTMKRSAFLLFLLCLLGFSAIAQPLRWHSDAEYNYEIPIGVIDWKKFQSCSAYQEDFAGFYLKYNPENMPMADFVKVCSEVFTGYNVHATFFFAAWNNDCHELLPAFIRWTEELENQYSFYVDYTLVALNRQKQCGIAKYDAASIQELPTILISLSKVEGDHVVDEVDLGKVTSQMTERNLETALYMLLAKYMKYHNR